MDRHIQAIIEEMAKAKARAAAKYEAIRFDPTKPRTSRLKTAIMEDLHPQVELAE